LGYFSQFFKWENNPKFLDCPVFVHEIFLNLTGQRTYTAEETQTWRLVMLGFLKSDPKKKLQKAYEEKLD